MRKTIYLVRHGKIFEDGEKRCIGITDLPLLQEGVEQAERIGDYFESIPIEVIYSSPLKRCVHTAQIINQKLYRKIIIVEAFKEINMGQWEDKTFDHIKLNLPEEFEKRGKHLASYAPLEGESFEALARRVIPAFLRISGNSICNSIIVAHAGVNRIVLSQLLNRSIQDIFSIDQPYGCVYQLVLDGTEQWHSVRVI